MNKFILQNKLDSWWVSLTGSSGKEKKHFTKVRRGGPWNRELELYYSLLEEYQITPIEEEEATQHQCNAEDTATMVLVLYFHKYYLSIFIRF